MAVPSQERRRVGRDDAQVAGAVVQGGVLRVSTARPGPGARACTRPGRDRSAMTRAPRGPFHALRGLLYSLGF